MDLLAVEGTLKSLLQHHSSKASTLLHSAFFRIQLSHPYMTTGKTIALTRRTFVGKSLSCVRLYDSVDCSTPGLPVCYQLLELSFLKLMSIESVMLLFVILSRFPWGTNTSRPCREALPLHPANLLPRNCEHRLVFCRTRGGVGKSRGIECLFMMVLP